MKGFNIVVIHEKDPMIVAKAQDELTERMDPGFWNPEWFIHMRFGKYPLRSFKEFISDITYGPIITGKRPLNLGDIKLGVAIIGQKQFTDVGLDLSEAIVVEEGSEWDLERARVKQWDLLFPRSGVGSLGKGRMGIFPYPESEVKAVVSCFVDLIRINGILPQYVLVFLKSRFGQLQIRRFFSGVGTININFSQIGSIQIHDIPLQLQQQVAAEWDVVNHFHEIGIDLKAKMFLAQKHGNREAEREYQTKYKHNMEIAEAMLNDLIRQVEEIIEGKRTEIEPVDRILKES